MFISALIGGIIFIGLGYRFGRKLALIRTGWIIIGVISLVTTMGIGYLAFRTSLLILLLIFIGPLFIIGGLIATLTAGIINLIVGFGKVRNKTKIINGFVLLGINLAIVTTLIVLLVMFTTGIIPIRLM